MSTKAERGADGLLISERSIFVILVANYATAYFRTWVALIRKYYAHGIPKDSGSIGNNMDLDRAAKAIFRDHDRIGRMQSFVRDEGLSSSSICI